jgi:hypothetical protein
MKFEAAIFKPLKLNHQHTKSALLKPSRQIVHQAYADKYQLGVPLAAKSDNKNTKTNTYGVNPFLFNVNFSKNLSVFFKNQCPCT